MLNCAVLDDYQNISLQLADWNRLRSKVNVRNITTHLSSDLELERQLSNFEILVVMRERTPITHALLERLPKLKLIITSGMRNASIDVNACKKRGIVVSGTASGSEPPVELTWALLLGLARNLVRENNAFTHSGPWQSTIGADLFGKQLGLLGLGKIGSKVAAVGQAFGMKVVAWSPNLTVDKTRAIGVELAPSKDALLESSDFVSIHLVLGERSRLLIGEKELSKMRPTSFLINTSRAGIVDTEALIAALKKGTLAGAGVDVFDLEPLPDAHPLRSTPNLLATPHLGYVSMNNYKKYFTEAVEDIEAFLAGSPIRRLDN